jgi:hypothetical protein
MPTSMGKPPGRRPLFVVGGCRPAPTLPTTRPKCGHGVVGPGRELPTGLKGVYVRLEGRHGIGWSGGRKRVLKAVELGIREWRCRTTPGAAARGPASAERLGRGWAARRVHRPLQACPRHETSRPPPGDAVPFIAATSHSSQRQVFAEGIHDDPGLAPPGSSHVGVYGLEHAFRTVEGDAPMARIPRGLVGRTWRLRPGPGAARGAPFRSYVAGPSGGTAGDRGAVGTSARNAGLPTVSAGVRTLRHRVSGERWARTGDVRGGGRRRRFGSRSSALYDLDRRPSTVYR